MMTAALFLVVGFTLTSLCAATGPLVTLNHGGQLSGKQFTYRTTNVELFLGVPYAKAPVGDSRFKKPVLAERWTGVREAKSAGSVCPQIQFPMPHQIGDEDCLFLDITVPGGIKLASKRPVMVWFHGGGYSSGSKGAYIGAPLAVHGDVIVVAVNYRLAILGFLSDGPGTGNFGLWDQQMSLRWIKENIAHFGGDPDRVTIFGESAGGGSVSAQMMGRHSDGLFQRAIQESGSLYTDWGWYLSQNRRHELVESIKQYNKCPPMESVYQCLRSLTVAEVFASFNQTDMLDDPWHPVPDNDFFPSDISEETYDLTERFDLLAGFNGQEGGMNILLPALTSPSGYSSLNGTSVENVKEAVGKICKMTTPLSIRLCTQFIMTTYGLDSTDDDQERGRRLSYVYGELSFNADTVQQLSKHSKGSKATYGYYFTELFNPSTDTTFFNISTSWVKTSAFHTDELPFVFGGIYSQENNVLKEYGRGNLTEDGDWVNRLMSGQSDGDKPLTDLVMRLWTNFAKSSDPNSPEPLPAGTPVWPQFDTATNQFIELNSAGTKLVTTPHKERLEKVQNLLFKARHAQVDGDRVPVNQCSRTHREPGRGTVIG